MAVRLALLGLPRLVVDGEDVAVTWARRTLGLLTYVFTAPGPCSRDNVACALWPDDDVEAAQANLRRNLNLLRGLLPAVTEDWLSTKHGAIEFRHDRADTDVAQFQAALAAGDAAGAVRAYGGDFAASSDDAWVVTARERLRARFHTALAGLAHSEFSARHFDAALAHARRIAADEPFREDVARRIIAIRYAMGDRPGALLEYDRFARGLRTEMNVEPMPETAWLRDVIVRGEPLPFAPDAEPLPFAPDTSSRQGPSGSMRPRLLPFTGREAALDQLAAAWDAACAGHGCAVFVRGEAGIGKTRLIAEFLERFAAGSARILCGTTSSPESRPYEAILAAFGQAAPFVPALDLDAVWLADIAALVPGIAARTGALAPRAPLPADREAARLFESFARFAGAVARGRPTAIVLEDLHWAQTGSLEAIRYLAGRLRALRILLLLTFRSDEEHAVSKLERELCTAGNAHAIALARLTTAQTLNLLESAQPPVVERAAEELAARSEGHPLFLTELLRDDPASRETRTGGIGELVRARLARCHPEAALLARIAAVCGPTFDIDMLGAAAGWDDGLLVDRLAELLARQFIRATAAYERGSYAFSHSLIHAAVLTTADEREQRRIHRIAARVLEARAQGQVHDVDIARHWAAAGEGQRAAEAYVRAAQASLAAHARDEAAQLATQGLALTGDPALRRTLVTLRIEANIWRTAVDALHSDVEMLRALAHDLDVEARFDAALIAWRVEETCGDVRSRLRAADALRALIDADSSPLHAARVASVDANNALASGNIPEAIDYGRDAAARFAACGSIRDELHERLIVANALIRQGRLDEAERELGASEPEILAFDDPALTAYYWYVRSTVAHARRDGAGMIPPSRRVVDLSRAIGDRSMEAAGLLMIAAAYQNLSQLSRALRELDAIEEIYASIGAQAQLDKATVNRASTLLQIGRIDEAAVLLRELHAETHHAVTREAAYYAALNLGCAMFAGAQHEAAQKYGREALRRARDMSSEAFAALALGDLGTTDVALGNVAEGLAELREAIEINRRLDRLPVLAHDLARASTAEPLPRDGAAHARAALAIVEADSERIALAAEILNRCAGAFERDGDAGAADYCRRRGREIVVARLHALEGDDRAFYFALPWHRSLFEAGTTIDDLIGLGSHAPAAPVESSPARPKRSA
jgi:DNA-binding SARP family transcriptional activator